MEDELVSRDFAEHVAAKLARETAAPLQARINELETELAQVRAELAELRRFSNPAPPAPGEQRVVSLVGPRPERISIRNPGGLF